MNAPITPAQLLPTATTPDRYSTHVVKNQAGPAAGFNAFDGDVVLTSAVEREAPWAASRCSELGRVAGDEAVQELARLANRHLPELKTHDRYGNRIDWVEFHPSWHDYREAPLNSIWEGSAKMMCMDVRRAMLKAPDCRAALFADFREVRSESRQFDSFVDGLDVLLDKTMEDEFLARPASEALARTIQGAELLRHSTGEVIDGFMATRLVGLGNSWGTLFGTLGPVISQAQADAIVDRAQVVR